MKDFNFYWNEFIKIDGEPDCKTSLTKYINFILNYKINEDSNEYCEFHHILPRCNYPKFSKSEFNIIKLKYNDHKLAHSILFDAYNKR